MHLKVKAARKLNPDELSPGRSLSPSNGLKNVQVSAKWSKIEDGLKRFKKNE